MPASWLPRSLREDEPLVVAGCGEPDAVPAASAGGELGGSDRPAQSLAAEPAAETVGGAARRVEGRERRGRAQRGETERRSAAAGNVEGDAAGGAAGEDARPRAERGGDQRRGARRRAGNHHLRAVRAGGALDRRDRRAGVRVALAEAGLAPFGDDGRQREVLLHPGGVG